MQNLAIYILLLSPLFALSQNGDTVFTVKKQQVTVNVFPGTTQLYKNVSKKFTIRANPGTIIDTIVFFDGTILRRDSVFAIKPSKTGTGMLKIYAHSGTGKRTLAYVREFTINTFSDPKPNIDGVSNDSAIQRMKITAQGYINVPRNTAPELKRISYPVLSFMLQTAGNSKIDTQVAAGNRLTLEMRNRIDKMRDGSLIQINNIKYLMEGDTFIIREPLKVSLLTDKIIKF